MECRQVQFYRSDYLSGNLPLKQTREFDKHLRACISCNYLVQEEKKLNALLRGAPIPDPGETYWENLEKKIVARTASIGRETDSNIVYRPHLKFRAHLKLAFPVAAGIILFLLSLRNDIATDQIARLDRWAPLEKAAVSLTGESRQATADHEEYFDSLSETEYTLLLSAPGLAGRNLLVMQIIRDAEKEAPL